MCRESLGGRGLREFQREHGTECLKAALEKGFGRRGESVPQAEKRAGVGECSRQKEQHGQAWQDLGERPECQEIARPKILPEGGATVAGESEKEGCKWLCGPRSSKSVGLSFEGLKDARGSACMESRGCEKRLRKELRDISRLETTGA